MKKYIVIAVDFSDSSDHKGSVLGVFDNRDDAVKFIHDDMDTIIGENDDTEFTVDYNKFSISTSWGDRCEYSIAEVEF